MNMLLTSRLNDEVRKSLLNTIFSSFIDQNQEWLSCPDEIDEFPLKEQLQILQGQAFFVHLELHLQRRASRFHLFVAAHLEERMRQDLLHSSSFAGIKLHRAIKDFDDLLRHHRKHVPEALLGPALNAAEVLSCVFISQERHLLESRLA